MTVQLVDDGEAQKKVTVEILERAKLELDELGVFGDLPLDEAEFSALRTRDKISPTDPRSLAGARCSSIRHEIHFG